jgi:hypothetical protein
MSMPFDDYHPLRDGLRNLKASAQAGHPVEQIQQTVRLASGLPQPVPHSDRVCVNICVMTT